MGRPPGQEGPQVSVRVPATPLLSEHAEAMAQGQVQEKGGWLINTLHSTSIK